jgi:hypothetical protein
MKFFVFLLVLSLNLFLDYPAIAHLSDSEIQSCLRFNSTQLIIRDRGDVTTEELARVLKSEWVTRKRGQITSISIQNCPNLRTLPVELFSLNRDLNKLTISGSGIQSLPTDIKHLRNLSRLNLSKNQLKRISKDVCNLPLLEELDVTNNSLNLSDGVKSECDEKVPTFRYVLGNHLITPQHCMNVGFGPFYVPGLKTLRDTVNRAASYFSPQYAAGLARAKFDEAYRRLSYPKRAIGDQLGASSLPSRSGDNLSRLEKSLGELTENEKRIYELINSIPFTLKHHTPDADRVMKSGKGQLLSNDELFRRGIVFQDNSESEGNLGNRDFVFFTFATGTEVMPGSRYGDQVIVIKPDRLYENGWVYFHDLIDTGSGELKNKVTKEPQTIVINGQVRRRVEVGLTDTEPYENLYKVTYYNDVGQETGKQAYRGSDRYFYGKDIKPGVGMSLLNEIKSMGPDYEEFILRSENPQNELIKLIPRLYRIQALIPNHVDLTKQKSVIIKKSEPSDD